MGLKPTCPRIVDAYMQETRLERRFDTAYVYHVCARINSSVIGIQYFQIKKLENHLL
jgi:hypothetical protein